MKFGKKDIRSERPLGTREYFPQVVNTGNVDGREPIGCKAEFGSEIAQSQVESAPTTQIGGVSEADGAFECCGHGVPQRLNFIYELIRGQL